jgi:predicted nucleic acid-binding protein
MKIYLDNCCFNRPFDDQSQIRIRLESEAKLEIQEEIRAGKVQLIWSYILDYENNKNPYQERLIETANLLNQKGLQKIDSLHIACAIFAKCEYFLTTDDKILQRAKLIDDINVNDPIGFIKEVLS